MKNRLLFISSLLLVVNMAFSSTIKEKREWFSHAIPCWAYGHQHTPNYSIALHKAVDIRSFESAKFHITASSSYRFYLNGEFLGYGPSIAAHGFFRVDEYDLRNQLKSGTNVLSIEVVGYNVDNFYIPNQSSFVQAELTIDGKVMAATLNKQSPEAFSLGILEQRIAEVPKFSFQRPYMEVYQLKNNYQQWRSNKLFTLKAIEPEETDRKELLARNVKYPDYTIVSASQQINNGIMGFETVKTGFIQTKVTVEQPSKIRLSWDEILVNGEIIDGRLGHNSYIDYMLEPGVYTLESFEPYTLMFLKIDILEGKCTLNEASIRQYVNSDVSRASFTSSDGDLNKIFKAAVETYKQNALDVFMDCPSRERAGWLCDSYFTSRVAFNLSGSTLIETNFLENFLLPDKFKYIPEGMLPMCYPSDHADGNFIPNWAMWFVLELEEYQLRSLDYEMIIAAKPRVMALLDYFKRFENEDGLLEKLDKWVFVEWSKANEFVQDVNYPSNMLYAKMIEVVGKLYGMPEHKNKAEQIRKTIREQAYINGFFCDNAIRENGKLVVQANNQTEVCQNYAFFFKVATPETYPDLWKKIVEDFGAKRKETNKYPHIYPANAFIGNYLRLEFLAREGLTLELIEEAKKQFTHMADLTGTLWENITPATSTCHGFASHIAHVLYRDIAGVKRIDLLNKEITLCFNPTNMKNCAVTIPLGNDSIILEWIRNGKTLNYSVDIPEGYTLRVENKSKLGLKKVVN